MMYSKTLKIWTVFACLLALNLWFCSFSNSQTSVPQGGEISAEEQLEKLSKAGSTLKMLLNHFSVLPEESQNSYKLAQKIYEMIEDKLKLEVDKSVKDMEELDLVTLMRQKYGSPRDMTLLFAAFLQMCKIDTAVVADEGTWLLLFQADANTPHTVRWNQKTWGVIAIPVGALFSIGLEFKSDLDKGATSGGLRQEFKNNSILLSLNATTLIEKKGSRWLITDKNSKQAYRIRGENEKLGIYPVDKSAQFAIAQQQGIKRYRQLEKAQVLMKVIPMHSLHWEQNLEDTIEVLIREGIDYGQRDELQEAQKRFSDVQGIDPKNAAAINNLGNLNLLNENIDAAIQKYKQALQIDRNDSAIYLNLGIAYYQKWKRVTDKKQKRDLEKQYQDAFDEAYRGVQSGLNLCRYLGINLEDESDAEYCWLVYDAEGRVSQKEPQWRPIGGRGKQPGIPVYWKNF